MSSLNKAQIIGRLGQDPEIRYMPNGNAVANISVATSEKWKDKQSGQSQEKTEWHRVVLFNKTAEVAGEYLRKGSQVYIEGKIQTKKWQDNQGNDRYTTEIIGSVLTMLGHRDDAPQQQSQPQQQAPRQQPQQPQQRSEFDDDIPF